MNQTFTAISQNGILEFNDPERLKQFLLFNSGNMVVSIGKERRIRSNKQNRYGYGIALKLLSEHTGHDVEELKKILKKRFGWMKVVEFQGQVVEIERSTADMTTAEFELFMTQIRGVGDQLGVYIPSPNEPVLIDN